MIEAARSAVEDAEGNICTNRPLLLAVTVLTSMTDYELKLIGINGRISHHVTRLAMLAMEAGADGLVCSPYEVASLRKILPHAKLMVPGIRPVGSPLNDQTRVMTPIQAIEDGADWVVIGRPITKSDDPAIAAMEISRKIDEYEGIR
jgi:orotidine-5'-phosphate decarboxylase